MPLHVQLGHEVAISACWSLQHADIADTLQHADIFIAAKLNYILQKKNFFYITLYKTNLSQG